MSPSRRVDAEKLRDLRRQRGLSVEDLAYIAELSASTLRRLEGQRHAKAREETLVRLAEALKVEPNRIAWSRSSRTALGRIGMASEPTLVEVATFFSALQEAYVAIDRFLSEPLGTMPSTLWWEAHSKRAEYSEMGELVLFRASFQSPGFWEVLGNLNPLTVICTYLDQRHERAKDRKYRNQAEERRLALENALLENQVVRERLDMMKEHGFPEEQIRSVLFSDVAASLERLGRDVDRRLIESAEVVDENEDDPATRTA